MARRLITISGFAAAATAFLCPLVFGLLLRDDFDPVSQYISELGARGAPLAGWVNYTGFLPTGLLTVLFALAVLTALPDLPRTRCPATMVAMVGVGYVISSFFPCDPGCPESGSMSLSQLVHNLAFIPYVLVAPLGVWRFGRTFRRSNSWRHLSTFSQVIAPIMLGSMLAMVLPVLQPWRGLLQWCFEGGFFVWLILVNVTYLKLLRDRPAD